MKGIIRQRGKAFQVRYFDAETGKEIARSFPSYGDAEMFLAHLNVSRKHGSLDARDYARDNPLGFRAQAEAWLKTREGKVRDLRHVAGHIGAAIAHFGDANVKAIGYGELEDFFAALGASGRAPKTVHNHRTTLHAFFQWFYRREKGRGYALPEFPVVEFELGWRKIVDKATQEAILAEVKRISDPVNPRIWFGITMLANFPKIRPEELRMIDEGDINRKTGEVWVRHTKEGKAKRVYLLEEDLDFIRAQPEAIFGRVPFFRHTGRRKGIHRAYAARAQGRFGEKYLYKWWKEACKNLGIEGVDLYGGTKHSTVTAASAVMTPEEIRRYVTAHATNAAFDRYLQVDAERQREASQKVRSVRVLSERFGRKSPAKPRKSKS